MIKTAITILATTLFVACSGDAHDHDHGDSGHTDSNHAEPHADGEGDAHGPHGGHVLEVGDHVAHLEVLHDEGAGKITLYVLGTDGKSPLAIEKAPQLKLLTADGPKALDTKAQDDSGSVFAVTDTALKGQEPQGRVTIVVNGKVYNPGLEHDHDH